MIKYALACDQNHAFDSWFPSSDSFDAQAARGLVTCPVCGSAKVAKVIMAPQVARRDRAAAPAAAAPEAAAQPVAMVTAEEQDLRAKIRELRDHLLAKSDPVGDRFAEEARKIHYGESEHRTIHGQATAEEVRELHDEGIEFHPIPVLPDDRN